MSGADLHADVLIVGAGPIGCTFASVLVPAGRSVLMTDAGPQLSARPGSHLKNAFAFQRDIDRFAPIIQASLHPLSVPVSKGVTSTLDPISFRGGDGIRNAQNPRQDARMNLEGAAATYAVGGMFTHWTNNTPRHHPVAERIGFIDAAEWDVLYGRAERLLNTRRDVFSSSVRHRVVQEVLQRHYGDRLDPETPVQAMPVAGERRSDNDEFVTYTGADTILEPLLGPPQHPGLRILAEHRVKYLVLENGKVVHALAHDLMSGRELVIAADLFIVAAGSILTPQILWASGVRPRALGSWLTEHPLAFTQVVLSREIVEGIRTDPRFAVEVAGGEAIDPVPIPMHDPPPSLMIPVSVARPWHCQIQRDSFSYGALPPDVDTRLVVDLRWFGMVDPIEANGVTFHDDARDTFGMPKPTFFFTLGDDDRRRAHEMMQDMVAAAGALGGFLPGSEPRFMPPGLALHFMGTHRMGPVDDGTCVTDPLSRVWDTENLYLGGNGQIPTRTASNPTLTSVALALRAADNIVSGSD